MNDEYLIHYGVKGMKWGVRRARKYADKGDRYRRISKAQSQKNKAKAAYKKAAKDFQYDDKASIDAYNKAKSSYSKSKKALSNAKSGPTTKRVKKLASEAAAMSKKVSDKVGRPIKNISMKHPYAASMAKVGAGIMYRDDDTGSLRYVNYFDGVDQFIKK